MYALLKHKTKHLFAILISTGLIALVTYLIFIALNITSVNEDNIITEKTLLIDNHSINLVYFKSPKKGLVIYISDSNFPATAEYAKKMAELSYYVANIDSNFLLSNSMITKNNCLNIAEKILNISHQLQKTYSIDKAELPILVGNNEGATLVYIALAQADITSFHAGVSINFAPQIATKTSFCQNINDVMEVNTNVANSHSALNRISSSKHLGTNWYIFQNTANAKNSDANNFIAQINNAKLAVTESTTNNSGIVDPITEAIQILQWLDPRLPEQVLSNNSDSDLPLIEVPVKENQKLIQSTTMAVLLTGDGGWAEIDKNIANELQKPQPRI